MATINKDGTIDFGASKGLLSISEITKRALTVFSEMQLKQETFEQFNRVNELRKSCGAEPQKITIKANFDVRAR